MNVTILIIQRETDVVVMDLKYANLMSVQSQLLHLAMLVKS